MTESTDWSEAELEAEIERLERSRSESKLVSLQRQGKTMEADGELVRLIQEGIDLGPGIPVTPKFWAELRTEVDEAARTEKRRRAA